MANRDVSAEKFGSCGGIGDVDPPSALKVDATRIEAAWASCHAVYNN